VTRIDVPFIRLVFFFLKAVVAAIPALILLTAIFWVGGQLLETFYPELVKMKILISFPG
jgi:cation transporter-like permease